MDDKLFSSASEQLRRYRRKKIWNRLVKAMAVIVVFCTTYALILPAITLQQELICDKEEHIHTEECYTYEKELLCDKTDEIIHEHNEDCYKEENVLICEEETEQVIVHEHNDECYKQENILTCKEETEQVITHEHIETCYNENNELICTELTEQTITHEHNDTCYKTENVLTCAKTEEIIILHEHTETCYELQDVLKCEEKTVHEHVDDCYQVNQILLCEKEEHEHIDSCYKALDNSDPSADIETRENWEATLNNLELTNNWRENLVKVAESQLGYKESSLNFHIAENGEVFGYTRYGQYYQDIYSEWNHLFVGFCIDYSNIVGYKFDTDLAEWINALTESEMIQTKDNYKPLTGDIIFFDTNQDSIIDRVGIVSEINDNSYMVIEGDYDNQVVQNEYEFDNETIIAYGITPINPEFMLSEEEQEEVDFVISLIDGLPTADEFDAKLYEFDDNEDYDGYELYFMEMKEKIDNVYWMYDSLTDTQKEYVTNKDKILEFEYIWSQTTYIEEVSSAAPTIKSSVSTSDFVQLNLYDYKSTINTNYKNNNKYPGFQWNGGAYVPGTGYARYKVDCIDFGNSMITDFTYGSYNSANTIAPNRQSIGNQGGTINKIDKDGNGHYANRPIGYSTNVSAISRKLLNGYPALIDNTSLSYLFSNNTYAEKKNTANIDGLFQLDSNSGEYFYDSRDNHAQYSNNRFTLYNQIITPNFILYPFGNFLPFSDITNLNNVSQVSKITKLGSYGYIQDVINDLVSDANYETNGTKHQLIDMLAKYRSALQSYGNAWTTWTAADAINDYFNNSSEFRHEGWNFKTDPYLVALLNRLYNIDFDVKKNFFLGMDMQMNFIMPKNGLTGKDNGNNNNAIDSSTNKRPGNPDGIPDYPMEFYFAGDDDVWVYIDNILFLDLTGIHRHVGGKIDFVNGKVYYYAMQSYVDGAVSSTPYYQTTFAEILKSGGIAESELGNYLKYENGKYTTFLDYSSHKFNFYYMERGSGSSVCRINFNFPLLRQNSINISKELTNDTNVLGDPDFKFQVLKANANGTKTNNLFIGANTTYNIYNENDTKIGTGKTDANGVLTLKAGQRAEFTGIEENSGKYYVRELFDSLITGQYDKVTVSGEETTTSGNIVIGTDNFTGVESSVKDMSDGSTIFKFTNQIVTANLNKVELSKELTETPKPSETAKNQIFKFAVLLDGKPLSSSTKYTLTNEDGTSNEKSVLVENGVSYVELKANQKVTVDKILCGSIYKIYEVSDGYVVKYLDNETELATKTDNDGHIYIEAPVEVNKDIQIIAYNTESNDNVQINVTKQFIDYDDINRKFTFVLEQVLDQTGTSSLGIVQTTELDYPTTTSGMLIIPYRYSDLSSSEQKFYYKVYEQNDSLENVVYDTGYAIIEVTVKRYKDSTTRKETVDAQITKYWLYEYEGKLVSDEELETKETGFIFKNTLVGDLKITKELIGSSLNDDSFEMTVKLTDSQDNPISGTFTALLTAADNTTTNTTITFDSNGETKFSLKQNESLKINDLPYLSKWTVTETITENFDYDVLYYNNGTESDNPDCSYGVINAVDNHSKVLNNTKYALPETGGDGTYLYTLGGVLLMMISFIVYLILKRREEVR